MHRPRCLVGGGWSRTCTVLLLIVAGLAACESDPSKLREPGTEAAAEMTETPVAAMATATATLSPEAVQRSSADPTATVVTTETIDPTSTARATDEPAPTSVMEPGSMITFTIVYDNQVDDPRLTNKWGFACLIEMPDTTILFDTGGDAPTLLENMAILGKDPGKVDVIVLSHRHGDHTGGVQGMLETGAAPTIYMLASFPESLRRPAADATDVVEVTAARAIAPGVWTTGEVGGAILEQALVVEIAEGWVLVTGCAHPGVATMASRAIEVTGGTLALVVGGFHLGSASPRVIQSAVGDLQAMGVVAVAPTHCTGEPARVAFAEAYGERYYAAGAGSSWVFEAP